MSFWDFGDSVERVAFIENEIEITYSQLQNDVSDINERWKTYSKSLVFLLCKNTYSAICIYLSALQSKHTVCMLPSDIEPELLSNLLERYEPEWIAFADSYALAAELRQTEAVRIHEYWLHHLGKTREKAPIFSELAVLLSTSGTTGSPKMVRLSYDNLNSNASSIKDYLELDNNAKPITTLPISYSYGLSVINSHLAARSTILLTEETIISRKFWNSVEEHQATSIAGVPYTYQILHKMGIEKKLPSSLRQFTQAGGRLPDHLQEHFAKAFEEKGIKFYMMYGQTEATARMSYLPPDKVIEKRGSIGIAIPGGNLQISETEELIYKGPNVMLGYAENRDDLADGDLQGGMLRTGDLAVRDEEGYFFVTGRMKRFVKIFGLRINLDDIENQLEKEFQKRVFCVGNDEKIFLLGEDSLLLEQAKYTVTNRYKLHPSVIKVKQLEHVPVLSSGKIDYAALKTFAGAF